MARIVRKGLEVTLRPNTRFLFLAGVMFFFWALYDGTVSFIAPLLITEEGFSPAAMGLLISTSSVCGALFDVLIGRYLTNPHWRRVFVLMFAVSVAVVVALFTATSVLTFMCAMALWGLYFNFMMFGMYDFVSVNASEQERGKEYGVLNIFRFLGYILAPLILGFLIFDTVGNNPFIFLGLALALAFVCFVALARTWQPVPLKQRIPVHAALHSFMRDGKLLVPVLVFVVTYNIVEAFFWTIGPLLALQFKELHPWEGLFVTAYFIPMLLTGWFVGRSTARFGKKRSAFVSLAAGSVVLISFFFLANPYVLLAAIFFASFFTTFALPCINAAIVDYVAEDRQDQTHIEAMVDFSSNIGYIIGPVTAGFLAYHVGTIQAFGFLGVGGFVVAMVLLILTPKHIRLMTVK